MKVRVGEAEGGCRVRGRPRIHGARERSASGRGVTLHSQAREFVCSLREFFKQEEEKMLLHNEPPIPFNQARKRIACALKISERSVSRISKEKQLQPGPSRIVTPGKERPRASPVTQLDSFQLDATRRHIYGYYTRKKHPTTRRLLSSLKEEELFEGSLSSLNKVLHDLGFEFKKINNRKLDSAAK